MAYATVDELKVLLRLGSPSTPQDDALERCLDAATMEIDSELGLHRGPAPDPVPALVREVSLERAAEHWKRPPRSGAMVIGSAQETRRRGRATPGTATASSCAPLKTTYGIA